MFAQGFTEIHSWLRALLDIYSGFLLQILLWTGAYSRFLHHLIYLPTHRLWLRFLDSTKRPKVWAWFSRISRSNISGTTLPLVATNSDFLDSDNEFALCPGSTSTLQRRQDCYLALSRTRTYLNEVRYRPLLEVPALYEPRKRIYPRHRSFRYEFILLQSLCIHGRFHPLSPPLTTDHEMREMLHDMESKRTTWSRHKEQNSFAVYL